MAKGGVGSVENAAENADIEPTPPPNAATRKDMF